MPEDNDLIKYVTCADIGGSHITAAVIDLDGRRVIDGTFTRLEVNSKGTWANILGTWIEALKRANAVMDLEVKHVALAMPGPFDYENGISYITGLNKYEAIYGLNVKNLLSDQLKINSGNIKFRNDAEATIAGEVVAGAGRDLQNVVGVTLGTGFGSAQHIDNQTKDLNLGSDSFKNSIADDYLSTRWFLKAYYDQTGISVSGGVKELASIADTNSTAKGLFKEFAINMSNFLADPLDVYKPEVLILCGNIAKASPYFLPHLKKRVTTIIKLAELGEHAALIGAAALFQSELVKTKT